MMTTWHVGNLGKSNPSIFVTQLSQGEEKSLPLESGLFYNFNLSSDMIVPRHFVTSFVPILSL